MCFNAEYVAKYAQAAPTEADDDDDDDDDMSDDDGKRRGVRDETRSSVYTWCGPQESRHGKVDMVMRGCMRLRQSAWSACGQAQLVRPARAQLLASGRFRFSGFCTRVGLRCM